jgi:hypothetical protein
MGHLRQRAGLARLVAPTPSGSAQPARCGSRRSRFRSSVWSASLRVLVACEFSGVVREAFRRRGHDAWSCDLLPAEDGSPYHYQGDVRNWLGPLMFSTWLGMREFKPWDLMIAHPPCTYLSVSGLHWNKKDPERAKKTEEALDFVRLLLSAPIGRIALENPISCISTQIRKPDQIIQPWQFGHDASKRTCLWLKNLPKLRPTALVEPRYVGGKPRWSNQTDSGQNKLGPTKDRWKLRAVTYQGIADAMAEQWGEL